MHLGNKNVPDVCLIPVTKWNDYYEWPPIGGMRHLIHYANTNGFAPAFKRVGRRVLVDADRFWEIVEERGHESWERK